MKEEYTNEELTIIVKMLKWRLEQVEKACRLIDFCCYC